MLLAPLAGSLQEAGYPHTTASQLMYQADAVRDYFNTAAAARKTPTPVFNAGGRAYPDISMHALSHPYMINGRYGAAAGTSASAFVAAAASSNINAARMAMACVAEPHSVCQCCIFRERHRDRQQHLLCHYSVLSSRLLRN